MIPRYSRAEMTRVWSDENRYRRWLEVELAVAEAQAQLGMIPPESAATLRALANFDIARIEAIETEVRHDVIAFTTAVAEQVGPEARYLHYGLTSSDVLDTGLALQLGQAYEILAREQAKLSEALRRRALEHRHTPIMGRTHGMHAEPLTLGMKFALWYSENQRNRQRLAHAAQGLKVGKISGAVGAFAHLAPEVETQVCQRLGLAPAPISNQILQRDRHAAWVCALALAGASLEKIATEIRHLQRSEVGETEEYFAPAQKGSSAMPHKRNPVTSEQICGLARVLRGHAQAALENIALWHERDISHSSVERIILPDSAILLDYMLAKTTQLIEKLIIYPERMRQNLDLTKGLIYSGQLLLELAEAGMSREDAYRVVQRHAQESQRSGRELRELLENDPEIRARIKPQALAAAFDLRRQLRHADFIIDRALASE